MNRPPSQDATHAISSVSAKSQLHIHLPPGLVPPFSEHAELVYQAYNVYCDLVEAGQAVDCEEFCARYPAVRYSLAKVLGIYRFFHNNSALVQQRKHVDWPKPGDDFAGFRLVRELGRGAFARVFEATEPALGQRRVVLKIALRGNAEAATLGRVAHPNIVPVHSITQDEITGLTGVCMPYLGETTLLTLLDKVYGSKELSKAKSEEDEPSHSSPLVRDPSPLPSHASRSFLFQAGNFVDDVRLLAIQLADALAFMHAKGICHRDLKPSNVLVSPDGTPMLLDFNLAADVQCPWILAGGTPGYMSPEEVRAVDPGGAAGWRRPDARSDLYSLGVILYELLTGKAPFGPVHVNAKGEPNLQLLLARQQRDFHPIRQGRPEVDSVLAGVVEQCLAFDPEDRPQTAAAVVRALRRSQRMRARIGRWLYRRRRSVGATCLLFLTALCAAVSLWASRPAAEVAHARLGYEAAARGDFKLAVHHYTESLRAKSDQPEVFFARGRSYLKLAPDEHANYSLAGIDFTHAEKRAVEERLKGRAIAFLAYSVHKQGQILEAIHLYEEALRKGFRPAEAHNNLARLHLDRSQMVDAQEHLDRALRIKPHLGVAHHNQAFLYYQKALQAQFRSREQKDLLEKAIDHFRKAGEARTGDMTLMGAHLCASAAVFDPAWIAPALEYLGEAIDRGIPPSKWHKVRPFTILEDKPGYQSLLSRTPRSDHPPTTPVWVVEPATD